jgi:hypothetical protein
MEAIKVIWRSSTNIYRTTRIYSTTKLLFIMSVSPVDDQSEETDSVGRGRSACPSQEALASASIVKYGTKHKYVYYSLSSQLLYNSFLVLGLKRKRNPKLAGVVLWDASSTPIMTLKAF